MRKDLQILIHSFGFHKSGIPDDPYENGGGFVFDCRAIENPGRYEEFMQLTGLDKEIINFLQARPEAEEFLAHTDKLIEMMINFFLSRNFNHLMISFGCTGGRHRSVFCAEKTAAKLRKSGFAVDVIHKDITGENISK
ncbi:MAG: hypothetical protein GXO75_11375 [Calditrichaeota bacterium]|nr:hypothetical protein [Calditrichota bacterium]